MFWKKWSMILKNSIFNYSEAIFHGQVKGVQIFFYKLTIILYSNLRKLMIRLKLKPKI